MEKDRRIKKYSVMALIIAVLGITIVYAVVSSVLKISGTARVNKSGINVVFEKIPGTTVSKSNGFDRIFDGISSTATITIDDSQTTYIETYQNTMNLVAQINYV